MQKGVIFDIKRCAIHDGPGIRTTGFRKGRPANFRTPTAEQLQKTIKRLKNYGLQV
jgi:hypothetical protein